MIATNHPDGERQLAERVLPTTSGMLLLFFCCLALLPISDTPAAADTRCESTEVRLQRRTLHGEIGLTPAAAFGNAEGSNRVHQLIRFDRPLTLDQHAALDERGIELLEYIENCTYIVSLSKASWLDFTRREGDIGKLLGPLVPEDKIGFDKLDDDYVEWATRGRKGHLEVLVGFHRDVTYSQAKAMLMDKSKSPGVVRETSNAPRKHGPGSWAVVVEIKGENLKRIKKLAKNDLVRRIEQGPTKFVPLTNTARREAKTDQVQGFSSIGLGPTYRIAGDGVRIGICDQGIDLSHEGLGSARVYDSAPTSSSLNHGTWVASIAAGNGEGSAGNFLRGHAPKAGIGTYPPCRSREELYKQAIVDNGTRVTNHSYKQTPNGTYGLEAQGIDRIIRGGATFCTIKIPARPQVWAAGNSGTAPGYGAEGYYSIKASAKNAIVVGSMDTADRRLSSFSSLGPTWDGRIKPDLVAPGCRKSDTFTTSLGVQAAKASSTNLYETTPCGTSMSAPVVTGIIALMIEELYQAYFPRPVTRHIRPATYKAILVNTAVDMVKKQPYGSRDHKNPDTGEYVLFDRGPDFATGFGAVDALAASHLIRNKNQWIQSSIGSSGEIDRWCISVASKTAELKVTVAWDDEPGTTGRPWVPKLVNDIDLALISPSGGIFRPWTVSPPPLSSTSAIGSFAINPGVRAEDHLNNVEMVRVSSPEPGIWHVVIGGYFLKFGTSQYYSLAASNEFLKFCPEFHVDLCENHPSGCPPMDVCGKYPWLCQTMIPLPLEIEDRVWKVDPLDPAPLREICAFLADCPECEGKAWKSCPGWTMVLDGVPGPVTTLLFDQDGRVLEEVPPPPDAPANRTVGLSIDGVFPGQELYLGFVGPDGGPYPEAFSARIGVTPPRELPGEENAESFRPPRQGRRISRQNVSSQE